MPGTNQHDQALGVFWLIAGTTLVSILMPWLYLRTDGSVLVAGVVVHLMSNSAGADLWALDLVLILPAVVAGWDLHRTHRSGPPLSTAVAGGRGAAAAPRP